MTARAAGISITTLDEGISLTTQTASIDFVGPGVTASNVGDAVTVTINAVPTAPGGADTHIQFNNAGVFGGSADFTFDGSEVFLSGDFRLDGDIIGVNNGFSILPPGANPVAVTLASTGGADTSTLTLQSSSGTNNIDMIATPSDFIQFQYGGDVLGHTFNSNGQTMNFIWSGNTIDNLLVVNGSSNAVGIGLTSSNPNASAILELNSTSKGLLFPRLTTAQRTGMTDVEGMLVYDTDDNTIYQNDGSAWAIPGAGLTTLQSAYNNSLGANPMITLDGVPTPISIQASVSGSIVPDGMCPRATSAPLR